MSFSTVLATLFAFQVTNMPNTTAGEPDYARVAVIALRGILSDTYSQKMSVSRRALKRFVKIGRPSLPIVLEMLRDENARVREDAASLLYHYNPVTRPHEYSVPLEDDDLNTVVQALIRAADDRTIDVARRACSSLAHYREDSLPALPVLRRLLSHTDDGIAISAAHAIKEMGPGVKPAVPELTQYVRRFADHETAKAVAAHGIAAMHNAGADGPEDLALYEEMAGHPSAYTAKAARAAIAALAKPKP